MKNKSLNMTVKKEINIFFKNNPVLVHSTMLGVFGVKKSTSTGNVTHKPNIIGKEGVKCECVTKPPYINKKARIILNLIIICIIFIYGFVFGGIQMENIPDIIEIIIKAKEILIPCILRINVIIIKAKEIRIPCILKIIDIIIIKIKEFLSLYILKPIDIILNVIEFILQFYVIEVLGLMIKMVLYVLVILIDLKNKKEKCLLFNLKEKLK